ncbi:MAG: hypothetical protein PGN25_22490 [Methylorubrum populi]
MQVVTKPFVMEALAVIASVSEAIQGRDLSGQCGGLDRFGFASR